MGRGAIFTQQLLWKPFNLMFSHFTAIITWREGSVQEEIQIAKVKERWQYAISVTDRENGAKLISCHDRDFPSSEPLAACFPGVVQPSE
jgi:hypothetical protein